MAQQRRNRQQTGRPNTRQAGAAPQRQRNVQPSRQRPQHAQHARPTNQRPQRGIPMGLIFALIALLVAIIIGVVLFLTQCQGKRDGSQATNPATQTQPANQTQATAQNQTADQNATKQGENASAKVNADSWELTLVNKTHPLPDDWEIELAEVDDGKYVDARIADQFTQMIADCRAAGFDDVFVNQAYRSHEEQQAIWDEFYNQYLAQGYSEEEATELTGESVAVPGTSEHELGLAADICSINFDEEYNGPIQTWLRENGHKYGFIQRYPAGKEDITGTKNENWHFRYVGVEAATQIYEAGQVLEEYLGEVPSSATNSTSSLNSTSSFNSTSVN